MNKKFKRFLFLILMVMGIFLPNSVSAREYDFGYFYNKDFLLFDGDEIVLNDNHKYNCGGVRTCDFSDGENFSLNGVRYNGTLYSVKDRYNSYGFIGELLLVKLNPVSSGENYVFNYRGFIDSLLKKSDVFRLFDSDIAPSMEKLLKDNSKVPYVTICSTDRDNYYGVDTGYGLCLDFDNKIILKLNYLNVDSASNDNLANYKLDDGTVVLKDLQRDDYKFDGWYLDSDYKYRITELNQDFIGDYYNGEGDFKNIDRISLRDDNEKNLIGEVNLFAKWIPNKITSSPSSGISTTDNPNTLAPIGIVIGVLLIVGVATGVIFSRKKKNDNEGL